MYRAVIEAKRDITNEALNRLRDICISAHKNRAGNVEIKELSENCFSFEGEEKDYGCLQLGYLTLNDIPFFRANVQSWIWEDEDPDENCNLLVELSKSA